MPTNLQLIERLRRASGAVYLACEASVAEDLSGLLQDAAIQIALPPHLRHVHPAQLTPEDTAALALAVRPAAVPTENDAIVVGHAMIRYGGGFVAALGEALLRADRDNILRIWSMWHGYWENYAELARLEASRGPSSPHADEHP